MCNKGAKFGYTCNMYIGYKKLFFGKYVFYCKNIFTLRLLINFTNRQKNDITGNADYNARSLVEYHKYKEFFASDGWGIATYIFLLAKDNGSMIRKSYLNETIHILDLVSTNISIFDRDFNKSENFKEFCISFCNINNPVIDFYNAVQLHDASGDQNKNSNSQISLSYPISQIFGRDINLIQNFFGVEVKKEWKNTVREINSVKMIVLQLRAEQKSGWTEDSVRKFEMDVVKFFEDIYKSPKLKIYVLSKTYVEDEMVRATNSSMPYLAIGFLVMCICSIIFVLLSSSYMHQKNYMKIILAVLACILPFMSCATALGLLFLCGVRFASILVVIPFLVLAIAVDSSYLLIHEWQQVVQKCRNHPGPLTGNVGYRLSEVLAEVGPSILISALTNILADFIGIFTSSEEIAILCTGTLVAMVVAFVYQMTFYIGFISIIGRYEVAKENNASLQINGTNVNINVKNHTATETLASKIICGYVNFLSNKVVALLIMGIYFAYLAASIWGITLININLTTQKLFALDSPLIELDKLRVQYQVPQFTMVTVFVNNPGNLSDTKRISDLGTMIKNLEELPGSWGPNGTRLFVRDFLEYENLLSENETVIPKREIIDKLGYLYNPDDLMLFIQWPENTYYRGFIKFQHDTNKLDRFFFTTAYKGENLKEWSERAKLLNKWRATVDKYSSEFDTSVFHEDGIFLDLIEYMPINTLQSLLWMVGCMAIVCLVFLKSTFSIIIATISVLSIFTGLLGSLSHLGMDLDPITMAAMLIALGYSVDIPAHVSYHYHQASYHGTNQTPQERLVKTFSTVAFPIMQAGFSTSICVCSLLFIKLYMARVFVKSTVLTIFLCNLHGLVFLPVFIILFHQLLDRFKKNMRVVHDTTKLDTFQISTNGAHQTSL